MNGERLGTALLTGPTFDVWAGDRVNGNAINVADDTAGPRLLTERGSRDERKMQCDCGQYREQS
jgi:hypothetical protein